MPVSTLRHAYATCLPQRTSAYRDPKAIQYMLPRSAAQTRYTQANRPLGVEHIRRQ